LIAKPTGNALTVILKVGMFVLFAIVAQFLFAWALLPFGVLIDAAISTFLAATIATALSMRIYEHATLAEVGFPWNRASVANVLLGLGGGIGAALIVLLGPVAEGAAAFVKSPESPPWTGAVLAVIVLLFGGIGEEMLFHGYGFQILMRRLGPFATILPVSVLFAVAHSANLNASPLGLVNTGLWGVVLGYAFWRSGDLWLPIGLHVGWNWMLPLFGTPLSGFTIGLTGYTLRWNTSPLWSGGAYGPEGGLLTTAVLVVLFVWLAVKAPIGRQTPFLLRGAWDD
jgi:membrane protease YdiL (CAAX protease family)